MDTKKLSRRSGKKRRDIRGDHEGEELAQDGIDRVVALLSRCVPVTLDAKLCDGLRIAQTVEAVVQRPLIRAAGSHSEIDQVIALDRIDAAVRKMSSMLSSMTSCALGIS